MGNTNNTVKLMDEFPSNWKTSVIAFTPKELVAEIQSGLNRTLIFIPYNEELQLSGEKILEWEQKAIKFADILLFWFPMNCSHDDLNKWSAYFGRWACSGKVIYGREGGKSEEALQKFGRLDLLAKKEKIQLHSSLQECIATCDGRIRHAKVLRRGGERTVPLHLWNHPAFQLWYSGMKRVGNRLDGASFEWQYRTGSNLDTVLHWVLHVDVWVKEEDRNKSNEIILARTNVEHVFAYHIPTKENGQKVTSPLDCDVLLIKEFHPSTKSPDGYIHSLPGGHEIQNTNEVANVLSDQIGIKIPARDLNQRLVKHGQRQPAGTTCTGQALLVSIELNSQEFESCVQRSKLTSKSQRKVLEAEENFTFLEIKKLRQAVEWNLLDWTTIGMIHVALHQTMNREFEQGGGFCFPFCSRGKGTRKAAAPSKYTEA